MKTIKIMIAASEEMHDEKLNQDNDCGIGRDA